MVILVVLVQVQTVEHLVEVEVLVLLVDLLRALIIMIMQVVMGNLSLDLNIH